jgi:hyperosmotically inducible periplasmic protein
MNCKRTVIIAAIAAAAAAGSGCSVMRGQESAGGYVDDTAITTSVKSKMIQDKSVDASSIKVETLNGTVQLSGFAKSAQERSAPKRSRATPRA